MIIPDASWITCIHRRIDLEEVIEVLVEKKTLNIQVGGSPGYQ